MIDMPRVFVSRCVQDEAFAMHLVQDLLSLGIEVWATALTDEDGGSPTQLAAALGACEWLLVIQTPEALQSATVATEVQAALRISAASPLRGLIALQLAPCDPKLIPPSWQGLQHIDATAQPYEFALVILTRLLRGQTLTKADLMGLPARTTISRRSMLIGTGVALAAVAVGGVALLEGFANKPNQISAQPTTVPPTPRPGDLLLAYYGHNDQVYGVAWSPDGMRIASGASGSVNHDTTIQLWDAHDATNVTIYRGHTAAIREIAWSSTGQTIASCAEDHTAQVWNPATLALRQTYRGHINDVDALAWAPDDHRIVTGSLDFTAQVWNPTTDATITIYPKHTLRVNGVAWSPDGTRVASCSYDQTAQIWDPLTGVTLLTYTKHKDRVFRVRWSPNGQYIATSSADHTVHVWNPNTGDVLRIYSEHTGEVYPVAWSPDGTLIASGGEDHTVRVWNAFTGVTSIVYTRHTGWVNTIAWSPDGTRIASGSDDRTVQIWLAR